MLASLTADGKATFQYCDACGEEVLTYAVRSTMEIEHRCSYCGLPLSRKPPEDTPPMECVLLADDEKLMRWTLRDLLLEQRLAATVVACESGAEILQKFTERLVVGEASHLVILDILMKDLDGVAAAKAIRAVERAFEVKYQVPIIFLSALRLDTSLRNFVSRVQPALFLNKGVDATPDKLGVRLRRLMEALGSRPTDASNGRGPVLGAA